ncbi:tetratricopeptide repeat protein [Flavobacterium amniphilum]|uniref:tetratricopeptide repeat protein n=1 Tax=Flavobacterium amniphilum TaxID=1834035 RepID=UPI00202A42A9|nr:tetratricopeptide repeat protein [Flavobacterium amniphilum]MCL9806610.1 tetratricopeptide repeat protein [Flavobacterium amniphilum]
MKFKILPLFLFLSSTSFFAQEADGYWDNQRMTNKEIKLSAGEKIIVKSEDFPIGTTEFVYRITLLDENQKIVGDLASVLKAIPDPYYIGKGTGGALSLASGISGSDKCTYAVFQDQALANAFAGSGKFDNACVYQKNPVSKDVKVISLAKNICLDDEVKTIWFAFKNENWMMNEKIVLEIVPWVDKKASRGWNKINKKKVLEEIHSSGISSALKSANRSKFDLILLEKAEKQYRFQDYSALTSEEKKIFMDKYAEEALTQSGLPNAYNDIICQEALKIANKGNIDEAIEIINNKVISKPNATALQHNWLAELYIKSKQFEKALKTLKNAEKLDASELKVKMNLAHVYMFMNEVGQSKEIHKKYMNQNISAKQTWKNKAVNDLNDFTKTNLPQENIQKIWRLYN